MRISYKNLAALSGSVLSATNQNDNFPIRNIISNYLELPFKATGNSSSITIELDDDYSIDHVAWGFHNFSTLTIRYLDNLDAEISNTVIMIDSSREVQFHYEDVQDVRKVVLDVTTTASFLKVGSISTGQYYQFPDFQAKSSTPYILRGRKEKSGSNQVAGVKQRNTRRYEYSFRFVNEDQYSELETVLNFVGFTRPHFVDVYPGDLNAIVHRPFWGVIESTSDGGQKEFESYPELTFQIIYERVY